MATKLLPQIQLKELIKIASKLPANLRAYIFAEETSDKMGSLRTSHSIEEGGFLIIAKVTGRTMMGLLPLNDFVPNINTASGVGIEKAQAIAKDINEQIFQPVRESLMKVHGITKESRIKNQELTDKTSSSRSTSTQPEASELNQPQDQTRPVSLEELERKQVESQKQAEKERKELIKKLRESKNPPKQGGNQNNKKQNDNENGTIQARTTSTNVAWNGRTIDLRKIPPRRKPVKDRENEKENEERWKIYEV